MTRLPLFALLCCAAFGLAAQSTVFETINVDGNSRGYRLRVPPGADSGPARPLILNLHGYANNAPYQETLSAMNPVADTAGFYVAYPNAEPGLFFQRQWRDNLADPDNPDIRFLDQLIDHLAATRNVDPTKVFATGYSNGGGMCVALACALPDRIRGIAPVAAAIPEANAAACAPAQYRPLLQIHGTADFVISYGGGSLGPDLRPTARPVDFFRFWISRDGCPGPVFSSVPDVVPSDGTTADRVDLGPCASGNRHRFYRINGGDHDIPGPTGNNEDLYASAEIWRFFRAQGGAFAAPPALSRERAGADVWPNPANAAATFRSGTDGPWRARLIDAAGRDAVVLQGSGAQGKLDLSGLPDGLYTLAVNGRTTRLAVAR